MTPGARARLFRIGLRPGFPDIVICYEPGRCLWLELKTKHGGLSNDQKDRHAVLMGLRHQVAVCRSAEDVMAALEMYDVPHHKARIAA